MIEEYRSWLDLPDGTPTITLREGGTPLVDSPWLSELTGAEVWLKVEGDNPTGSFKDRGMTVALSVAVGEGAEAVVCASTGNTSASMAAYAARAGVKPLVLVPQGKIAAGKLAQAIVHGAQVIMVRGNFDDCLRLSRGLADDYPVALVNSVNPMRLEGQKTASFEIVDFLGDAPDVHVLPGRQRRQHLGVLEGLPGVREGRAELPHPADARLAGRRRGAARVRHPGPGPGDGRLRDPDRQPGLLAPRGRGRRRLRRLLPRGVRRPDPRRAAAAGRPRRRLRRARVRRRCRRAARRGRGRTRARQRYAGKRLVVTVTGHGLKDIDTALSTFTDLVDTVVDADVDAAAAAAGLR